MVLYQGTVRASIEKKSIEDFSKTVTIINNMCWEFEGNTREYTLELGETIQGIYAANMPHDKYESAQLTNNIITGQSPSGNNLCLQIQGKKERCEQLDCTVVFPFIGAVPEEFSLSTLINQLEGRGRIYSYYLQFVRALNPPGVQVSLGPAPTTTTPTTLIPPTTTLPPKAILLITVNDAVSKVGTSVIEQYKQALINDGVNPILIRLDVDSDVKSCDAGLSASTVPVPASNAQRIIPSCITKYDAKYVVILGGHNYIEEKSVETDAQFYSDDWYADTIGNDGIPDVPIGRIPDGISHNDNVMSNYLQKVAIPLHGTGWGGIDTKFGFIMGAGGSTAMGWGDSECFIYSVFGSNCDPNGDCDLSPPNIIPSRWSGNSKLFYLDMHGAESGYQQFYNDIGKSTVGASDANSRNWDKTIALIYPCWGGRINNVDIADSFILNVLNKGAVLIVGGTSTQSGLPGSLCAHPPEGSGFCYSSNMFYKFVKNLSPGSRIGDAFMTAKQGFFSECSGSLDYRQGHHNVFYGDPSIKV